VNEPLELALERGAVTDPIPQVRYGRVDAGQSAVAMRQDPVFSSRWMAEVWPSSVGWHRLEADGVSLELYVADSDSWPSWRQRRRRMATRLAALRPRGDRSPGVTLVDRSIPRLPFYAILLSSLAILWLDERRGSKATTRMLHRPAETPR